MLREITSYSSKDYLLGRTAASGSVVSQIRQCSVQAAVPVRLRVSGRGPDRGVVTVFGAHAVFMNEKTFT